MAQNLGISRVSPNPTEPTDRNDQLQLQKLQTVFSAFQYTDSGCSIALDILLHDLAAEARSLPGASNAAIAIRSEGNHFVCRAAAGASSPALGTRIEANDGLSAECVRTGRPQVCQDAETDPRVNAVMCRALSIRSLIILPLFLEQNLIGILEVFAPVPQAFDREAIEGLIDLGNRVVQTMDYSVSRPRPGAKAPEARQQAPYEARQGARSEAPVVPQDLRSEAAQIANVALPVAPSVQPSMPAHIQANIPKAARSPEHSPERSRQSAQNRGGGESQPVQRRQGVRTPPPVVTSALTSAVTSPALDASVPTFASGPAKSRKNLGLALVALATGLAAAAGLLWLPGGASRPTLAGSESPLQPAAPDSQVPTQPGSAHSPSRAETLREPAVAASKPSPAIPRSTSTVPAPDVAGTGGLVVYENGKVVYRAKPGSGALISPVTSAAETEKLPDTLATSAVSDGKPAAGAVITGGRLIRQVFPVLPAEVAGLAISKDVELEGVVGRDGLVHDVRLVRGDARLSEAAIEAVRQWRYEPFLSNGEPVDVLSTLSVHFR